MSLVGIYSFPKSGNTWIRVILGAIMGNNASQIPDLHRQQLSEAESFNGHRFFKLHAGRNEKHWRAQRLDTTQVIHIRRNPLDVFVSYLNFISDNVTGSAPIKFTSVEDIHGTDLFDLYFDTFITTGHLSLEFAQTTGSYFDHNKFWMNQKEVPVILLKYEDMLNDAKAALTPLQEFLGIDDAMLNAALHDSSVATKPDGKFFWKQKEKNYLSYLDDRHIDLFLKYRGEECRALGYAPESFRTPL